jgi:hypothetical protein
VPTTHGLGADALRGKGGGRRTVGLFSPISAAVPELTTTSLLWGDVRYIYR